MNDIQPEPRRAGRSVTALALLALLAFPSGVSAGEVPRFSDVTKAAGIDYRNVCGAAPGSKGWLMEGMGAGAAWLDYDGDGNLDLYLINGSMWDRPAGKGEPNRLYRGVGQGRFEDVTEAAGVGDRGWGYGVAVGDIDNDGDPDIYVTNNGPNVLYLNDGDGTFSNGTTRAGVGDARWSSSAAFFDLEGDGDLDLYVGNYMVGDPMRVPRRGARDATSKYCAYRGIPVFCGPLGQVPEQDVLYRNDGDGKFTDVTRKAGILLDKPRYTLGVVTGDINNDRRQDLYVANDSVQNSLWLNRGDGNLVDHGVASLSALNGDGRAQAGMGTDLGDVNGDGWLDLLVTNFSYDLNTLYRNVSGKLFIDDSARLGLGVTNMALSWGAGFHDFDLDADLDLLIANGHVYPQVDDHDIGTRFRQKNHLFLNDGKGRLVESSAGAGAGFAVERSFRGAAFADYDRDGDVDVLLTALDEPAVLLRNDGPTAGHFLQIDLRGKRSNRDGVGTRVIVTAGGRKLMRERKGGGSYLSASSPTLHFGLGPADRVSKVEVLWPSGVIDTLAGLSVDRRITVEEGGTSSP